VWNYRVVKRKLPGGSFFYAIHEAYYDDAGKVWSITQDPIPGRGDSKCEVIGDLVRMLSDARKSPVLDYDNVPEAGAVDPTEPKKKRRPPMRVSKA
jgi:hypothetical protein